MLKKIGDSAKIAGTIGFLSLGMAISCHGQNMPPVPTGPYQASCTKCSVVFFQSESAPLKDWGKPALQCDCITIKNKLNTTTLLLVDNTKDPINNCDGNLKYGACSPFHKR